MIAPHPLSVCLSSLGLLLVGLTCVSCRVVPCPAQPERGASAGAFPQSWYGRWSGPAESLRLGGVSQTFRMELIIAPTDDPARHTWTIIYAPAEAGGQGPTQERRYELVAIDPAAGKYEIDEKNSIRLASSLIGGSLWSAFEVQGGRIMVQYRPENLGTKDERLIVEMFGHAANAGATTGGEGDVPPVITFAPEWMQRAVLTPATRP